MKAEPVQPSSLLSENKPFAASACLGGTYCRYDGGTCLSESIRDNPNAVLLACPESLGGLAIPRLPSEIVGGDGFDVLDGKARVLSQDGSDVTAPYLKGAQAFVNLVKQAGVKQVVLKSKSPSCGVETIYDGTFSGTLRSGPGVTAALLRRSGITVAEQ